MRKPPWNLEDFRLIIGSTQVDYDLAKEDTNRRKHGYSLESAVSFLNGYYYLIRLHSSLAMLQRRLSDGTNI
jgi:uncharacterized DUF497 family protein